MSLMVDIEKQLGKFCIQVSFTAPLGEVTGLLGTSGSGKTVTLRCIAGLLTPDAGHIELDGRVLFDHRQGVNLPPQQRKVGYLFQQYALFPHYTVEQNIAVATRDQTAVEELLRRFQLQEHRNKRPRQLSGGQQQRVALARILAAQPQVLLLDEPFSALDTHLRGEIQVELSRFLEQFSGPCLMVTHSRDEVRRMCHRVCVVHHGASQPVQTTEAFFNHPRTLSACRLMGCPNISPLEHRGNGVAYATAWGLPVQVPQTAAYVAIQPHHIRLVAGPGDHRLFCRCTQVDQGPFSVSVSLACGDGALQIEVSNSDWQAVDHAQGVWVELPPSKLLPLTDE